MNRGMEAIFFATSSGGITLDRDDAGGNPFATALIELAAEPTLNLYELANQLRDLTAQKSGGRQIPNCSILPGLPDWTFNQRLMPRTEVRNALVLVVSDYSSVATASLPGAAWDERRISAMLARYGFSVIQGAGPSRASLLQALASFRRLSKASDTSVIYSTGHGVEVDGEVFLLPGDYPVALGRGKDQLKKSAVSINRIARAACAKNLNLLFFAGCRKAPRIDNVPASNNVG